MKKYTRLINLETRRERIYNTNDRMLCEKISSLKGIPNHVSNIQLEGKSGGSGAKFSRRTILLFIFMFNSELYFTKPWKIQ